MIRWMWLALALACNGEDDGEQSGESADSGGEDTTPPVPATTSTGAERVATIAALTGDSAAGAGTYAAVCSACHGATGDAMVQGAADLTVSIPMLTEEQILTTLLDGKGNMDSYASLKNQELADVAAYVIESFGPSM